MKYRFISVLVLAWVPVFSHKIQNPITAAAPPDTRVILITLDGFRWQEVFLGADSSLLHDPDYTPDTATLKMLYWHPEAESRRKMLMPFFWSVFGKRGQIFGNRLYGNNMNVSNFYSLSYPGYNEMLTGMADPFISSNRKIKNPNFSVLEFMNQLPELKSQVAVFASWNIFPYILHRERSRLMIYSGSETLPECDKLLSPTFYEIQSENSKNPTRYDVLTFLAAKEYLKNKKPKFLYIAFGETDEFAHDKRYDLYLQQANAIDRMIAELWNWTQTCSEYRNKTYFLITTDHGRGRKKHKWPYHNALTPGSSEIWAAISGPDILPVGEIKIPQQNYLYQIAPTLAQLMGISFPAKDIYSKALPVKQTNELLAATSEKNISP
ncbi:MAG: hypothetical protein N2747_06070 [Chitinophagaceae bacterium]|nr:hypothetical protein [Chitinophagaceae bacterium]